MSFAPKVYTLSQSWDTNKHVDQWEALHGQSTNTRVCTYAI